MYGALLALILVVANTLNGFTVVVFLKNRLLHTANNFLVVSLAVSDWLHVISGCLVPLLWFTTERTALLQQSSSLCRAVGYGTHIFYSASTNNLVLISFHRLVSIVFSQRKIIATMKSAKRVMAGLWIFTAATCLPGLFRDGTYLFNPTLKTCTILAQSNTDSVFATYSLALNFLFPLLLMAFFYLKIYKMVLHHKLSTVSETILTSGVIEKKSKRLIISVLGIFGSTWTPFYITLMLSAFSKHEIPPTALVLIWPLKMSSSMSNPILYAVCNRLYFRCMMRLLKCRGPLLNKHRQSPLSNLTHRPSCCSSSNELKEEEISTIAPLPDHTCDHCIHCKEPLYARKHYASFVNNCTQTSRYSSDLEPVPEASLTMGCRHSTCSHCTEISTSMSTRSSVPTIFEIPIQRFKRSPSTSSSTSTHVFGRTPDGQYFTDSGRSSFASQYGTTPSMHSNRTSFSSSWPNSNRTSLNSNYAHVGSTPRGSTADLDMKRLPSFSSRQSIFSSLSMPRSARSSVVSSRISHYAPMSTSFSARSSLTSQYTYGSTPFSTRPNTPQDLVMNTDVEWVYIPCERDSSPMNKTSSTPSTRHSSDTTLTSEKLTCRQIPDQSLDIFEDEEPPPSGASSIGRSQRSAASPCPSGHDLEMQTRHGSPDSTCQRVSMFLLGEIDPGEAMSNLADIKPRDIDKLGRKKKSIAQKVVATHSNAIRSSPSPPSRSLYQENSPQQSRKSQSTSPRVCSPRTPSPSPPRDKGCRHNCEKSTSPTYEAKSYHCHKQDDVTHVINSVGKAVNLVVKARRLRSRVQPIVTPIKPDTPVPEHVTTQVQRVPHVREPIRFVYEAFYPSSYYSSYGSSQMTATKNTLRVPGRPPPLNVPQTIHEEETMVDPIPACPETPTTPRRKNASSWIAPPVIDVAHGDEDMRVECPGVLVEHHN